MLIFFQKFNFSDYKHRQTQNNISFGKYKNISKALISIKNEARDIFSLPQDAITHEQLFDLFSKIISIREEKMQHSSKKFKKIFHDYFLKIIDLLENLPNFNNSLFEKFVEAFRYCRVDEKSKEASQITKIKERYIRQGGESASIIKHCESNFTSPLLKNGIANKPLTEEQKSIVEKNYALVNWTIKKFFSSVTNNESLYRDIFQEGVIGLMYAAKCWIPERGTFSTYAIFLIRQKIRIFLLNNSIIREPLQTNSYKRKINNFRYKFIKEKGYIPSDDEIATGVNLSIKTVKRIHQCPKCTLASEIRKPSCNKDSPTFYDNCIDDTQIAEDVIKNEEISRLEEILKNNTCNLTENELKVLRLYYGFEDNGTKTLDEIGKTIGGLTRERVNQIRKQALYKLKMAMLPQSHLPNKKKLIQQAKDPQKRKLLLEALDKLPEKTRLIFIFDHGLDGRDPKTRAEIAKEFKISIGYVSEIIRKSIKQLEENIKFVEAFNS